MDQTNYHNYYSWEQIDREFDLVLCIEILEHLSAEKAFELVKLSSSICKPGGYILFTVPNVYTPGIQLEFTHQTAYGINDIGGLCLLSGLNIISGARIFTKSARHQIVHKYFFYWLHRLLRIDFCQSIALLLRKPELNKKL
ncbi:MAG TPA: hypothetical protein DDX98_03825 [Bacteroidales bacterium]|nr:hypothetical protein [Bacteroidales bacterium]